jgi:hypothetical protein
MLAQQPPKFFSDAGAFDLGIVHSVFVPNKWCVHRLARYHQHFALGVHEKIFLGIKSLSDF